MAGQITEVADESDEEVLVAGCLPPLDVSYRPDLVPSDEESCQYTRIWLRPLIPSLIFSV